MQLFPFYIFEKVHNNRYKRNIGSYIFKTLHLISFLCKAAQNGHFFAQCSSQFFRFCIFISYDCLFVLLFQMLDRPHHNKTFISGIFLIHADDQFLFEFFTLNKGSQLDCRPHTFTNDAHNIRTVRQKIFVFEQITVLIPIEHIHKQIFRIENLKPFLF